MDQSSYLALDTNRSRKGKRFKKEEKTLLKKKVLGVKRNNEGAIEDGSCADEGRGPTLGLTDVAGLMKSL